MYDLAIFFVIPLVFSLLLRPVRAGVVPGILVCILGICLAGGSEAVRGEAIGAILLFGVFCMLVGTVRRSWFRPGR